VDGNCRPQEQVNHKRCEQIRGDYGGIEDVPPVRTKICNSCPKLTQTLPARCQPNNKRLCKRRSIREESAIHKWHCPPTQQLDQEKEQGEFIFMEEGLVRVHETIPVFASLPFVKDAQGQQEWSQ